MHNIQPKIAKVLMIDKAYLFIGFQLKWLKVSQDVFISQPCLPHTGLLNTRNGINGHYIKQKQKQKKKGKLPIFYKDN